MQAEVSVYQAKCEQGKGIFPAAWEFSKLEMGGSSGRRAADG